MKPLNETPWKRVKIFDESESFTITTTSSSVDSIRIINGLSKTIPYITRTNNNNGVSQFVSEDNYEYGSDAAGCISVGLDTQTAFYQPHRFITGQNIHIVKSNRLNKDFALFYTTILKKQMEAKFNWGGNGATLGRMKSIEALAPINQDGTQDYEYMTEYSKEKQKELLSRYKRFSEKETSKIESKKIPVLEEKEWKDYSVTSLFNTIIAGKGKGLNHLHKTTKNGISYIGATNRNNGVLCFVSEDESSQKMVLPGNCIGFIKNGDGSAGFAIYKAESFVSTSDVIYGYADWINKYTGLFLVAAQDMINLIVLRDGLIGQGGYASDDLLKTLDVLTNQNETAHKCGMRFLLIDDSDSRVKGLSDFQKNTIKSIRSHCELQLSYTNEAFVIHNNKTKPLTIIGDPDVCVQVHAEKLSELFSSQSRTVITLDDIKSDAEIRRHDSILTIPVGKSGTQTVELPLSCKDENNTLAGQCIGYMVIGQSGSG